MRIADPDITAQAIIQSALICCGNRLDVITAQASRSPRTNSSWNSVVYSGPRRSLMLAWNNAHIRALQPDQTRSKSATLQIYVRQFKEVSGRMRIAYTVEQSGIVLIINKSSGVRITER